MSFMWHPKAVAKAAAAGEEDEGEEILPSCNSSTGNNNNGDDVLGSITEGRIQRGGGNGGDDATISKSNDYMSRVTSETLFPLPILDPIGSSILSSLPLGDALESPPSPMSVASSINVDHIGPAASLFAKVQEHEEDAPSSPSSNLSMKPEALSDSLLDEVLAPSQLFSPPPSVGSWRPVLVETVEMIDAKCDKERPSAGLFMEPLDDTVSVATAHVDFQSVGRANAEQQQQHQQLASPPANVETSTTQEGEDIMEFISSSLGNETDTSPKEENKEATNEQQPIPWLARKWNLPKLDLSFFQLPTSLAGGVSLTKLVWAVLYMVAVATMVGLLLSVWNFLHYTKVPMTGSPPPVNDVVKDVFPFAQNNPFVSMSKEVVKDPIVAQPNTTMVQVAKVTTTATPLVPPPPPHAKGTVSSQAVCDGSKPSIAGVKSTSTAALTLVEVQVSDEAHEVIDLDAKEHEKYWSPTSSPQQQQRQQQRTQQREAKVPPPTRKLSISAAVYLSMVSFLSVCFLWLVVLLGGSAKQGRTKKFPPVAMTDWNFESICTALEEPLSGKGRQSKVMKTTGLLGWDPTNYEQLKMDEIHRLLHLLHAPSYNRNMNKSLLLCFLYEHYGTMLHKCNTHQLKAILLYKGVRFSCGTNKTELVTLARHAGFTATKY